MDGSDVTPSDVVVVGVATSTQEATDVVSKPALLDELGEDERPVNSTASPMGMDGAPAGGAPELMAAEDDEIGANVSHAVADSADAQAATTASAQAERDARTAAEQLV